ncbi:hypothetical protein ACH5RR_010046 [Cinchona calisaya]|uniref:Uncharacterized protein n=1 Tax=Cinchona calisaya TaxID=153742 RepID=A0ABD3AGG2_9GENT
MADSEGLIIEEKKPPNSLVTSTNAVNCRSNFDFWPNLKPFVNGFLAGQLTFLQSYSLYCFSKEILLPLLAEAHDQHRVAKIKNLLHQCRKRIPVHFLCEATHTTALFGSFDTLTKKIEAANDGFPLTLYQ